jgi:hypothetical protein
VRTLLPWELALVKALVPELEGFSADEHILRTLSCKT